MAVDADATREELSHATTSTSQPPSARVGQGAEDLKDVVAEDDTDNGEGKASGEHEVVRGQDEAPAEPSTPSMKTVASVGLVALVGMAGLAGWLGYGGYQAHRADAQRQLFLQVGRQGALNLTTIDYQHADADIQRILDSSTGTFYDDFKKRSQPFIEVVKKAQSKSVGTITEAGLESDSGNDAQVLVAVSVKTTNISASDQPSRAWRMRISVTKVDQQAKVSNVAFIP